MHGGLSAGGGGYGELDYLAEYLWAACRMWDKVECVKKRFPFNSILNFYTHSQKERIYNHILEVYVARHWSTRIQCSCHWTTYVFLLSPPGCECIANCDPKPSTYQRVQHPVVTMVMGERSSLWVVNIYLKLKYFQFLLLLRLYCRHTGGRLWICMLLVWQLFQGSLQSIRNCFRQFLSVNY